MNILGILKIEKQNNITVSKYVSKENQNIKTIILLKPVQNKRELNIKEAIEISKNNNNLLNWDLIPYKIIY